MANLPSAENRYPAYPGIPVAERHIVRHAAGGDHPLPLEANMALNAYLAGTPRGKLMKRPTKVSKKAVVYARVEHGRWLADCPWCRNAIFAPLTDPRFFCPECMNAAVHGEFVKLVVPKTEDREQIAGLLLRVPDERCRNWLPTETVEELAQQVHAFLAAHADDVANAVEIASTIGFDEIVGR